MTWNVAAPHAILLAHRGRAVCGADGRCARPLRPNTNYPNASDASALSLLPVAVSVAAPVAILSAGAVLTVVAVPGLAAGTVWVLERASDGARASVNLASSAVVGLGAAVMVTAVSAGWVLSAAGEAIAVHPE
jgi:hypothetical protein